MVAAQRPEGMSPARLAAMQAVPVPHAPVTPITPRARQIAAQGLMSAEQAQAGLDKGWLR